MRPELFLWATNNLWNVTSNRLLGILTGIAVKVGKDPEQKS